ncbi:type I polyketide synthase [Ruminiclostridium josui]|uniref:type I polyketide synthase n=1 Tax=Ruminiclostridium josui TaxID=1499 RepID=UPI00046386F2|nr:type I polyketide synthase [Ruminiclostridium josui]
MSKNSLENEKIAIIGMGCRLPGGINNPDDFWNFMMEGKTAIVDVPKDRWDVKKFYSENKEMPGKMYVKKGGFLDAKIDHFDPLFFGISPREAVSMDPQQRVLLEVVWEAFEDAGIDATSMIGSNTGVFVGGFTLDGMLNQMSALNREMAGPFTAASSTMTMISNRISHLYDFRGPSVSMDTACSSSLVAFHFGCRSLQNKDCDVAVVGGVNIMLRPEYPIAMCKAGLLSPDGYSKSFDERANGYGRGEGAGILILKPLSKALADGNYIYATVKETGVNQDGHTTTGISVPNPDAQVELMKKVLENAKLSPKHISYVEAHGTGTAKGDPIEVKSIGTVYGQGRSDDERCIVGSVKANVGHTEGASGITALIKLALCIKNRKIPPQANLININPELHLDELGLKLPLEACDLPGKKGETYVAVNSFGYGGTNAHAILQDYATCNENNISKTADEEEFSNPYMLFLSGRAEGALKETAQRYAEFLKANKSNSLRDICFSSLHHRAQHKYRIALIGDSCEELISQLESFKNGEKDAQIIKGNFSEKKEPVFIFTGMGPQWWAMGRELLQKEPVFLKTAKEIDEIFKKYAGWSILEEMMADEENSKMSDTMVAQPANFLIQACLLHLYESWGIKPAAVVGHSVGEVSSSYAAGVLTMEEAVFVSYHRSRIQKKAAGKGGMLAVGMNEVEANAMIEMLEEPVSIAAINSDTSITLSGDMEGLKKISEKLEVKGIFNRMLKVEVPYHSSFMEEFKDEVLDVFSKLKPKTPTIPLYSTVTGLQVNDISYDAEYWFDNMRGSVLFAKAMKTMLNDGYSLFLEVGPHPVLSTSIREIVTSLGIKATNLMSLRRSQPEYATFLSSICNLYVAGCDINATKYFGNSAQYVKLPLYPWQRESYWIESEDSLDDRLGNIEHPLLGRKIAAPQDTWESSITEQYLPFLPDHVVEDLIVLPAASYVETSLAVSSYILKDERKGHVLEDINFKKALVINKNFEPKIQVSYNKNNNEIKIFSRSENDKFTWTCHATAKVSDSKILEVSHSDLEALKMRCPEEVDPETLYKELSMRGLQYGNMFQVIKKLYRADNEVLSYIYGDESVYDKSIEYAFHPTLLDGCFQSLIAALPVGENNTTYLPVHIDQLIVYKTPEKGFYSYGRLTSTTSDFIEGDILIIDENGDAIAQVKGLVCQSINERKDSLNEKLSQKLYNYVWEKTDISAAEEKPCKWLVFHNSDVFSENIVSRLQNNNQNTVISVVASDFFTKENDTFYRLEKGKYDDFEKLFNEVDIKSLDGIIYLWNYDESEAGELSGIQEVKTCFHMIRAFFKTNMFNLRIYVVTKGLQVVTPTDIPNMNQAALVGLSRVSFNEYPDCMTTLLDVDPDDLDTSISLVYNEIMLGSNEDDVAFRKGDRYVHVLNREDINNLTNSNKNIEKLEPGQAEAFYMTLSTDEDNEQEKIKLISKKLSSPCFGEVEIELKALSLNSNTISHVLRSDKPSLMEISGTVTNIGENVSDYKVGDKVMGFVNSTIESHITTSVDSSSLIVMDDSMDFYEAASSKIPLITAHYILNYLLRILDAEKIFLTKAPDEFLKSIVQFAKIRNCEVYCIAGNEEEFEYFKEQGYENIVIAYSTDFLSDISSITKDNVSSAFIDFTGSNKFKNNSRLHSLLERFVIVKLPNSQNNGDLFEVSCNKNFTISIVDIAKLFAVDRNLVKRLFAEVVDKLQKREICLPQQSKSSLASIMEMDIKDVDMQLSGNNVLCFDDKNEVSIYSKKESNQLFQCNATYLITGGFGGFGKEIALWMAKSGVKNLVITSRRGDSTPEAKAIVKEIQNLGCNVKSYALDITDYDAVSKMICDIKDNLPDLKGVIHSAAVLNDGLIVDLSDEEFTKVLNPKILGALNLHKATLSENLEFFIMFSSVSLLVGNARQSNYVAANAFLDYFAQYRASQGLPATSISWGALGSNGMAEDEKVKNNLLNMGMNMISISESLYSLEKVIKSKPVLIGIADVDWGKWRDYDPQVAASPRFANLVISKDQAESSEVNTIIQLLSSVGKNERIDMLNIILSEIIGECLHISTDRIDINESITNIGIDSLLSYELKVAIYSKLGVEISTLELLKGISIVQLSSSIIQRLGLTDDKVDTETNNDEVQNIDNMSEEELDKLLTLI